MYDPVDGRVTEGGRPPGSRPIEVIDLGPWVPIFPADDEEEEETTDDH